MIKKVLVTTIVSLIFCVNIYASETLTAKPDADYEKAKVLYQQSIDTDSIEVKKVCRQQILKLVPETDLGYFSKAWLISIEDTPDLNKTIEYYTKAIELDPEYAAAYCGRGFAYYELDQYEAIDDFTKAIELDPQNALAYYNRGFAYYTKSGDYQEAIDDFTKAIELNPEYAAAYNNRGGAYRELGQYQKAIDDFTKAIELDPKDAEAYFGRGDAYREKVYQDCKEKGEYKFHFGTEEAIKDYTTVIKLNPKHIDAYYSRGLCYTYEKLFTAAYDDFYQAGMLYLKEKNVGGARHCLFMTEDNHSSFLYKKLKDKICEYYYQESLNFLKQNNRTEALKCIDYIKEVNSESPLIKKLMDKIYAEPKKKK